MDRRVEDSLWVQDATLVGKRAHRIVSRGSLAWKDCTAAVIPCSLDMRNAMSCTANFAEGVRQNDIASVRFSVVRSLCGIDFGPAPAAAMILPQNGWSPKNGIIVVGQAFRNPHAAFPAPHVAYDRRNVLEQPLVRIISNEEYVFTLRGQPIA